ncbi:phage-related lysozyme [Sulfuriferula multivorans]|uniref:Lysozyme n=1 Tax=Sulfuriferula multivorans TaxID=1559896 RepID=A0A401JF78_9PROT|nr:lysozyme [Sulfuriferula multivorans]GBL46258.1 phage-related lysozyme [Sulfuriferula multivorans]
MRRASDSIIQFIQAEGNEGFRARPYNDGGGVMTIGHGHVIRKHEKLPVPMTRAQADLLMRNDLAPVEIYLSAIDTNLPVPLTGNQFDGLCSLVFNIGLDQFEDSTLLKKLRRGDMAGAASQFNCWIYDNKKKIAGLVTRRAAERAIFESKDDG